MASGASAAYRVEEEAELQTQEAANDAGEAEAQTSPADTLVKLIGVSNLVPMLLDSEGGETRLAEIAHKVIEDYDIDKDSRKDWEKRTEDAMKLAMMVAEKKDYPFPGASNVKYPLVTQAALQFNARAFPALFQNDRVAKVKTFGRDADGRKAARAERVSEHLSWQLTTEMPEWVDDTDTLLVVLPIVGFAVRKTYYDPALGRKCSRLISASKFVINYWARSLELTPRYTEELDLYPTEIMERILDRRFVEFEYETADARPATADTTKQGLENSPRTEANDADAQHLFLEQHRRLDLDGDGYPEPYIVTVHRGMEKVCRIVANFTLDTVRMTEDGARVASIAPQTFFTPYRFLPSPDGGFYGMGLGTLLKDTNEAINSTINVLFDAGHLNNIQGGFIDAGAGWRGGKELTLSHGTFKVVNLGGRKLSEVLYPFNYPPPSEALFKLLGLLIEYGNDLASIKDVMTGETGGKVMQPTTVLALIEQGLKVFNAIFKRAHRSVQAELLIHSRLNQENLTPEAYNEFFDDTNEQFDPRADYAMSDKGLSPVSDATVATKTVALGQAALIKEVATDNPHVNQEEATRRIFLAGEVPDIDKLMVPPPQPDPAEMAFMQAMKELSLQELVAKIGKLGTAQLLDIANAEAAEVGPQLSLYDQFLKTVQAEHGMEQDNAAAAGEGGQGAVPGMAGAAPDGMGAQPPQGGLGPAPGAMAAGPPQPVPAAPGGVGVPAA